MHILSPPGWLLLICSLLSDKFLLKKKGRYNTQPDNTMAPANRDSENHMLSGQCCLQTPMPIWPGLC